MERNRPLTLGELIGKGRTADLYQFGGDRVVKLLARETPSQWAELEAEFTRAVGSVGLPVPRVDDVVRLEDRWGIVFEYIDASSMLTRMIERPGDVVRLVEELVALQRSIHAVRLPDGLPSRLERMRAKIDGAVGFGVEQRNRGVDLLDRLPHGGAVLHGDLHPGNILLSVAGPVVIDWFDAAVGHPAADVERTALLLDPHGATDLRHLRGASTELIGDVHRVYCETWDGAALGNRTAWRAVIALGRVAEGADASTDGLLRRWASSADAALAH